MTAHFFSIFLIPTLVALLASADIPLLTEQEQLELIKEKGEDIRDGIRNLCQCIMRDHHGDLAEVHRQCVEFGRMFAEDCVAKGRKETGICFQKVFDFLGKCGLDANCKSAECIKEGKSLAVYNASLVVDQ